ncbi:MAG: hypothetical protein PHY30_02220 [Candidatus Pacebacteria bacterium]|nr:hypothetical protein [Candidatus Paceibacterota bacterium]
MSLDDVFDVAKFWGFGPETAMSWKAPEGKVRVVEFDTFSEGKKALFGIFDSESLEKAQKCLFEDEGYKPTSSLSTQTTKTACIFDEKGQLLATVGSL